MSDQEKTERYEFWFEKSLKDEATMFSKRKRMSLAAYVNMAVENQLKQDIPEIQAEPHKVSDHHSHYATDPTDGFYEACQAVGTIILNPDPRPRPMLDLQAAAGPTRELVHDDVRLPSALLKNGEEFIIRVSGDSMAPDIRDGDSAYIRRTDRLINGKVMLVSYNGVAMLKQIHLKGKAVTLLSSNPEHPPLKVSKGDTLIAFGQVVNVFREM